MLILYARGLSAQPHYQPYWLAVLATIALAWMRWPFGESQPFQRSRAADVLLILGVGSSALGVLFVEPWFAALAVILFVTSLLARTLDRESRGTLWSCALPMYVYLSLPMGMDVRLITTLQYYSAIYTSRLLDLAGLGHHMDGTVIHVPNMKEYGIEQACSGVQSFFTLLLVAVVYVVYARRVKTPALGPAVLALLGALALAVVRLSLSGQVRLGPIGQALLLASVGLALFSVVGFRASLLILSAVFWAVFMNTIRILTIPLAESMAALDLSEGIPHDVLGYLALTVGIAMLLSTDQFLLFLFGPVEAASDSGPFGRLIGRIWNGLAGATDESESRRRSRSASLQPRTVKLMWIACGLVVLMGIWQLVDVQRSLARADKGVRFFDADVTVEFEEGDIPEQIDTWTRVRYQTQDRSIGSDLGERSDVWQFRSPRCLAVASLDQTFPGWHELTTCYRNQGWKLVARRAMSPQEAIDPVVAPGEAFDPGTPAEPAPTYSGDNGWELVEARFEKPTGEKGYLLFSHFDAFGEGLEVPRQWGTLNAFLTRAANRLSHRIRARLLRGESYQVQVFLTSYNDFDPDLLREARERYLKIRDQIRERFLDKSQVAQAQ